MATTHNVCCGPTGAQHVKSRKTRAVRSAEIFVERRSVIANQAAIFIADPARKHAMRDRDRASRHATRLSDKMAEPVPILVRKAAAVAGAWVMNTVSVVSV